MRILAKIVHGSHLYHLNGPTSDEDYKAIHLPDIRDCLLLRTTRNAQTKEGAADGDDKTGVKENESYALQSFLTLSARAEDVTISMLHAPQDKILVDSPTWVYLRGARKRFYTKKMTGSLGYARNMALKYGFRADRMADAEKVLAALKAAEARGAGKVWQIWEELPTGQYLSKTEDDRNNQQDTRVYEVAGKKLQATIAVSYAVEIIEKLVGSYGSRVRAAKEMNGDDLKAISHSFRVGYQLLHVYRDHGFSYPLPESDFIKDIKYGRLSYVDDKLDEKLNDLITEVERLAAASDYPERVDQIWLDKVILDAYGFSS